MAATPSEGDIRFHVRSRWLLQKALARFDKANGSNQPNEGARFDEMLASKLPVGPRRPIAAMEQSDRKLVDPLCA
jgi:hypothetical protein